MNREELERLQELISIEDVEAISSILQEKKSNEEILEFEIQFQDDKLICIDILENYLFDAKFWHRIFEDEIFTNLIYE